MHVDQKSAQSFEGLSDDAFISKAYMSLLGRSPDASGLANYRGRLQAGVPRAQIWSEIASADEAQRFSSRRPTTFSTPAPPRAAIQPQAAQGVFHSVDDLLRLDGVEFVRAAYRAVLGREADPTGLRDYVMRMSSGTSRQQLLADLRSDPEGQAYGAQLAGLEELVRGLQERAVNVESLDELLTLYGETFVRSAYLLLFKREPDAPGLARYLEVLRSGYSNMHVLKALYEAPEAREKSSKLPGLKAAIRNYDRAQLRSWKGWYYRSVIGASSELPRDRELRALIYRLSDAKLR